MQGLAPTFIAGLSDGAGRRPAFAISFIIYLGANIGLALQSNYAALLVLRLLQSAGSSSTIALGNAVVADIATTAERGTFISWVSSGQFLGKRCFSLDCHSPLKLLRVYRMPSSTIRALVTIFAAMDTNGGICARPRNRSDNRRSPCSLSWMAISVLVPGHFVRRSPHCHSLILPGNLPENSWGWVDQTGTMEYVHHYLLSHAKPSQGWRGLAETEPDQDSKPSSDSRRHL